MADGYQVVVLRATEAALTLPDCLADRHAKLFVYRLSYDKKGH